MASKEDTAGATPPHEKGTTFPLYEKDDECPKKGPARVHKREDKEPDSPIKLATHPQSQISDSCVSYVVESGSRKTRYPHTRREAGQLDPKRLKGLKLLSKEGHFGEVYEAVFEDQRVAVKMLKKDKVGDAEDFREEMEIMYTLAHPNICHCYGYTVKPQMLVMELYPFTLEDFLIKTKPPPRHCFRIAAQICLAVKYLHGRNIMHRDLKCENIFIDSNGDPKLGDFGLAEYVPEPTMEERRVGTIRYLAPEVLKQQTFYLSAEVFTLGLILYRIFSLIKPFENITSIEALIRRHERVPLLAIGERELSRAPQAMWDLIAQCCSIDPQKRPLTATIPPRISQIAVKNDIPHDRSAQELWLRASSHCYRERVSLLRFAQSSSVPRLRLLQDTVRRVVPKCEGTLTIENFSLLSQWFPQFWLPEQHNSMRSVVLSSWFAPDNETANKRLAQEGSRSFVVRPSRTNPSMFPFTLCIGNKLYRIARQRERHCLRYNFTTSIAPSEMFSSLSDLVAYLVENDEIKPAPVTPRPLQLDS